MSRSRGRSIQGVLIALLRALWGTGQMAVQAVHRSRARFRRTGCVENILSLTRTNADVCFCVLAFVFPCVVPCPFVFDAQPITWSWGQAKATQNEFSWTNLSSILFVEQPVGTGFSQGTPTARVRSLFLEKVHC